MKAILGNLTTTKNLGGILGGFTTTNNLYDLLGTFTPTENLKDILGNLTTTKNLGGILGGLDVTENLKALLGDLDTTTPRQLGNLLGSLTHTDNLKAILGAFTATENVKAILGNLTTTKNLGGILGDFTTVNNLKALLGAAFDPTDNLFACLGGYTATTHDSLKEHVNSLVIDDLTLGGAWHDAKSIAGFVRTMGVIDGADTVNSVAVVANEDGSVFERLEHLKSILDDNITDGTHAITNAHGIAETRVKLFTAHRTGELAVELDLNTLVAAGEGGTVTVRLKHMIDNATVRTIDIAQFIVGVDEVHPTVKGWADSANADGVEVTIQCSVAVPTVNRDVPYKILEAC